LKILIAGAGGYVGKNFINFFYDEGCYEIFTIARKKIESKKIKYQYIGDINKVDIFNGKKYFFDIVINLMADTRHFGNKKNFYNDNVSSLKSLLKCLDGYYNYFFHVSTEAVFLSGKLKILTHQSSLPRRLLSDYAWSKNIAEKLFMNFKNSRGIKVILRPRLIWGGRQSTVNYKINSALTKNQFFYVDGGRYKTSVCHIRNLYLSIFQAIKYADNDDVFFVVDKDPVTFSNFVKINTSKKNLKKKIINLPRSFVYLACLVSDLLRKITFNKLSTPLSLSLYYLTLSSVIIDDKHTREKLKFNPKNYM